MKALYKLLNIVAWLFMILGVVVGVLIKISVIDIPQLDEISSVIAMGYSGMIFLSGGIFFALNEFLQRLEEYLNDKDSYNNKKINKKGVRL